MRVSKNQLNPSLNRELFRTLHQAIADLKNIEEVSDFLSAFLSENEHTTIAKRVAVAYWLDKGRSYENIERNLKVSSATVSSVNNVMGTRGVRTALQKIKAEEWATMWSAKIKKLVGSTS
jgi:TrpR-related protein YerC/YecD